MPTTTIELHKEAMKFSAGHFTIFGPDRREPLHGHNFTVKAEITAEIQKVEVEEVREVDKFI